MQLEEMEYSHTPSDYNLWPMAIDWVPFDNESIEWRRFDGYWYWRDVPKSDDLEAQFGTLIWTLERGNPWTWFEDMWWCDANNPLLHQNTVASR